MHNIALPKKIDFAQGEQKNQKTITIEPLFPGYGATLGNSLRRVLLSSLSGCAVIGVKIEGASHEFMAMPNIKEDVLEILLNLKQLRLKIFGEEDVVKLEVDVHGEKEVKAGDIIKNSQVEIMNPDLHIAQITDMSGNLKMEIFVSRGMGYETTEIREKKENKEIGYIEIDSIFSPVVSVGVTIENTRVGKMTNWDKLILDVKTDGTIDPKDAFEESAKILINQFNSLLNIENSLEDEKESEESEEKMVEDDNKEESKKEKTKKKK